MEVKMNSKARIVKDFNDRKVVVIHDVIFKGKRHIDWDYVGKYLTEYVGKYFRVLETDEKIYIGADFPDEYISSEYTKGTKGARAKAKANAVQGLEEIITIATYDRYKDNRKTKHTKKARFGWYRFNTIFAIPVYTDKGVIARYNVFLAELVVRHDADRRKYLYDIVNIRKTEEWESLPDNITKEK